MIDLATAGAARAPVPVDLTGVDPARWPEIRRRIAILDEFIALYRPSLEVRTAFAKRMGLSGSQFFMLARVWRTTRSASAIPGARSRNTAARARRLPARSIEIMHDAINHLGPMARRKDVLAEVGRRCAQEGVEEPSGSTIANALWKARTEMDTVTDFTPEILIGECVVKLPVRHGNTVAMPRILLAIALPERSILAAEFSFDPLVAPSKSRLMATLETSEGSGPLSRPIRMRPHTRLERRGAKTEAASFGPPLSRVLGNRIGALNIVHRPSMARPASTLVAARHASALDPQDATTAINLAIAGHNAMVPMDVRADA